MILLWSCCFYFQKVAQTFYACGVVRNHAGCVFLLGVSQEELALSLLQLLYRQLMS